MPNQELRDIWDQRAERHAERKKDGAREQGISLYEKSWWRHIEPLLSDIPGGKVLEAGCGPGRWVDRLAPMGFEMVLSDISPKMLEQARNFAKKKGFQDKVRFEVSDIGAMDCLEDNSFDMAIATGEPVSMCGDPRKGISELCRVVRPGGYVLCDAGNRYRRAYDMFRDNPSGPVLELLKTGEFIGAAGITLHLLGPEELKAAFTDLGMELLTLAGITPMCTFPPTPDQKKALEDPKVLRDMEQIDETFSQDPGMVHLSARLIAVARKR